MTEDRWLRAWGLGYAAVGTASVLVPLYALELGASALVVGLLAASAAFAGVPGAVLWGRLASRTNRRRPFLLVALGSMAAVLVVVPSLDSPWTVLLANAGFWFVTAAAAPVLNLVVVDGVPEREWSVRIGRLNAVQGYGWVAGLVAGTVWTVVVGPRLGALASQRLLFYLIAGSTLLAFALLFRWYPEPTTVSERRFQRVFARLGREGWGAGRVVRTLPYGPTRLYWGLRLLFRRGRSPLSGFGRSLERYLVAATLFSAGFAVFWGPMTAYLVGEGFDTGAVFVLFVLGNLASAVCYLPVGRLVARVSAGTLLAGALAARVVLFPTVPLFGDAFAGVEYGVLAAGFVVIGVTWAVIAVAGTEIVTALSDVPTRGEAFGAFTALVGVGTGVGSAAGGLLADAVGFALAFLVAGALVLLGGIEIIRNPTDH